MSFLSKSTGNEGETVTDADYAEPFPGHCLRRPTSNDQIIHFLFLSPPPHTHRRKKAVPISSVGDSDKTNCCFVMHAVKGVAILELVCVLERGPPPILPILTAAKYIK